MRITESQVAIACRVASRVYAGQMTSAAGVAELSSDHGLNQASAKDFIYDYKRLMEGKVFQRAMSAPAMRYFLEEISTEHGTQGLSQAVASLRAHIKYYEGHYKKTMHAMRAVAESFEVLLAAPKSVADVDQAFEVAVERSLQDSQAARLRRLALASTTPTVVSVRATVFVRNPDVVAAVRVRAAGVCERCKCDAPFRRAKDGTPYLEVHHQVHLANGGKDSLENAIALCPNCHREAHYGSAGA